MIPATDEEGEAGEEIAIADVGMDDDTDIAALGGDVLDIGSELPPPVLEFDVDFEDDDEPRERGRSARREWLAGR